jgi:predicted Zn-dependent protease
MRMVGVSLGGGAAKNNPEFPEARMPEKRDFHLREWTTAIDRRPNRLHTFCALKTPTILIAAIMAGAFFAEAQTPKPEISRDSKLAIQAALADFDAKNYDAALKKLQVLDADMPSDPFIQNLLGAAYTKKKDYATAKTYFEKALEKEPDFFPAKFNVGELLFLQRQYAEAMAYFQKMLEKDPRNELLQFKVFLCQLQLGNKDEAAKALKGIKYPGDTPAWYYGQAAWESKNGNNKRALEYVTGAQYIFGLKTALFDETFEDLGIKLR